MSSRVRVKRRPSGAAAPPDSGQNVKVAVRCRPMNEKEKSKNCSSVIQCESSRKEVSVKMDEVKMAAFNFDCVFDSSTTQEQVYRSVVADVVEEALQGFNCTVFAYGQTGTGKTYTMEGHRDTKKGNAAFWYGQHAGMIPRATQHIFQHLDACCTNYKVQASYLELYNEELIDLLNPDVDSPALNLHYDKSQKAVVVPGLREVEVTCPEDLFKTLDIAANKRHTAETLLNKNSSRSHCVFTVTIRIQESQSNGEDLIRVGKLNLVDLAGSENTKKSGAKDDVMKQAVMINRSLLALGRVITALTSGKNDMHIPYRDSKLTRLLQESLGGRAKTCLIATVSPSDDCLDETRSTLKYAFRAKDIKNKPVLSQQLTKKAQIKDYAEEIESLKNQLWAARSKEGFFVDPTTWKSTLDELEQTKQEISDLKLAMEAKEELHNHLQTHFERKSTELNMSIEKCKQKERELEEATQAQRQAEAALLQSKEALLDRDAVIARQVHTERNLTKEASSLVTTVQQAAGDMQLLHGKVATQLSLSDQVQALAASHGSGMQAAISGLRDTVVAQQATQLSHHTSVRDIVSKQATKQLGSLSALCEASNLLRELTAGFVGELHVAHTSAMQAQEGFANRQAEERTAELEASLSRAANMRQQCEAVLDDLMGMLQVQFSALQSWKGSVLETLDEVDSAAAQFSDSQFQALNELQEAAARLAEETQQQTQKQNTTLAGVQMLHEELLDRAKADIMAKLEATIEEQVSSAKQELAQGLTVVAGTIQDSAAAVRSHAEAQAARVCQANDAGQAYQMVHMEQTKNLRNAAEQLQAAEEQGLAASGKAVDEAKGHMAAGLQADAEARQQELEQLRSATAEHLAGTKRLLEEELACKLHQMQDSTSERLATQFERPAEELQQQTRATAAEAIARLEVADEEMAEAAAAQASGLGAASDSVATFLENVGQCTYKPTAKTPKKTRQYEYPAGLPATCPHEEIVVKRRQGTLEEVPADVEIVKLLTNLAEEHQQKEEEATKAAEDEAAAAPVRRSPRHEDGGKLLQQPQQRKRNTRSSSLTKENHSNASAAESKVRRLKAPRAHTTKRPSVAAEKAGAKRAKPTSTADTTAKRQKVLRARRAAV